MQGMAGRVHAFEHAPGEFESLAVLGDGDTLARDGQDFPVQLRIQLVAVHGARRLDESLGSAMCGAPRGCSTAVARGSACISAPAPPA